MVSIVTNIEVAKPRIDDCFSGLWMYPRTRGSRHVLAQVWRLLLLAVLAIPAKSTTILTIYQPKSTGRPAAIFIGADSRRVKNGTFEQVCKINHNSSLYFMLDGEASNDEMRPQQIKDAIEIALNAAGTFQKKVDRGNLAVQSWLQTDMATFIRPKYPDRYRYFASQSDYPTGVTYAGFEKGKPFVAYYRFWLNPNGSVRIELTNSLSGSAIQTQFAQGYHDAFTEAQVTTWVKSVGPLQAVTNAVDAQIRKTPQHSGSPVSVVEIRTEEVIWHSKGECP